MRKIVINRFVLTGAAFAVTLLSSFQLQAQSRKPKQPSTQQSNAATTSPRSAELEADIKAATPGAAHQLLLKRVGEYTTTSRFTIPGSAPTESTGTARISAALDGRFLVEENSGSLLGAPIRGLRYYGYNNGSGKYEAIWTYTMSTAIMTLVGTSADGGKTVSYTATHDDANGAKQTLYVTTKQIDDDNFVEQIHGVNPDGTRGATVETTYVRRK
ncbi:MAG TPA: DUF1579 family protein [Blastocatellia bacterium]|nr:DUF1579 family protein [Blastocatellia bacterium]